jgi:hypothetical protein
LELGELGYTGTTKQKKAAAKRDMGHMEEHVDSAFREEGGLTAEGKKRKLSIKLTNSPCGANHENCAHRMSQLHRDRRKALPGAKTRLKFTSIYGGVFPHRGKERNQAVTVGESKSPTHYVFSQGHRITLEAYNALNELKKAGVRMRAWDTYGKAGRKTTTSAGEPHELGAIPAGTFNASGRLKGVMQKRKSTKSAKMRLSLAKQQGRVADTRQVLYEMGAKGGTYKMQGGTLVDEGWRNDDESESESPPGKKRGRKSDGDEDQ